MPVTPFVRNSLRGKCWQSNDSKEQGEGEGVLTNWQYRPEMGKCPSATASCEQPPCLETRHKTGLGGAFRSTKTLPYWTSDILTHLFSNPRRPEYNLCRSTFAKEVLMLSSTNFWMGFAGLIYLVAGVFILRKEISAARGWDKLITLGCVFIAVSLAVFAPEHFRGPEFVQNMVPSWMPAHWFWPKFVGCALLAAATSLTVRKFVRLSSTLLGLMFFLFVCMIYIPYALAHPRRSIRVGLRAKRSLFCRRRMGPRRTCIVAPRRRNYRNG